MIAQAPKVEIYVTSWCPYCKKATNYFESKGIPYVAYDIEKDPEAAARKAKLDTRGGVPFVVIRGRNTTHYIHGYSVEQFEYALSK
ncbi:MAG: hypothetical protein KKE17_02955 [Proteobacteria bacterium]|nr:hypothetical protein [Pseudomonadota bacterium]MBU1708941.1 hypothetical protein [Pseudomonadota bacterium]